jgi:ABC-type nitrate/sulfonate/bicarbonate transport system permease component
MRIIHNHKLIWCILATIGYFVTSSIVGVVLGFCFGLFISLVDCTSDIR